MLPYMNKVIKSINVCILLLLLCKTLFLGAQNAETIESVSLVNSFPTESKPQAIAYSPLIGAETLFAAVVNSGSDTVSVYSAHPDTGAFTLIQTIKTGKEPNKISFSPIYKGKLFAAVANSNSDGFPLENGSISLYQVDLGNGKFTEVDGSPFSSERAPSDLAFSPEFKGNVYLAVSNSSNIGIISVYQLHPFAEKNLELIQSLPVSFRPLTIAYSPIYRYRKEGKEKENLFAAFTDSLNYLLNVNKVKADGTLAEPLISASTNFSLAIAFSPLIIQQLFIAAIQSDSLITTIFQFNPEENSLTPIQEVLTDDPSDIAYSSYANGKVFSLVSNFKTNTASFFQVDQLTTLNSTTGSFSPLAGSPIATEAKPSGVAFAPLIHGKLFAGVVNLNSDSVSVYRVTLPPSPARAVKVFRSFAINSQLFKVKKLICPFSVTNTITWKSPLYGASSIVKYQVYRDNLEDLIAEVSSSSRLIFKDQTSHKKDSVYYLVAIDDRGRSSKPKKAKLTKRECY